MVKFDEIPSTKELTGYEGRYIVDRMNEEKTKCAIKDTETGNEFAIGVTKLNTYKQAGIVVVHEDDSFTCEKWSNSGGLDF